MKKHLVTLAVLAILFSCTSLLSQNSLNKVGRVTISAGIGLIPSFHGKDSKNIVRPLSLRIGFNASRIFNLSGFFGYSTAISQPKFYADGAGTYLINESWMTGLRGELRKDLSNKVDVYGGIIAGFSHSLSTEYESGTDALVSRTSEEPSPYDPDPVKGRLLYAGFIGSSFYFNRNLGLFGEAGFGNSLITAGLKIRL